MTWIRIIIVIVIFLIFSFRKDYKENVQTNITNLGGMKNKYKILIEYLTAYPSSKITKLTQDSIVISAPTMTFHIDYVGTNTEIELFAFMPLIGKFSKKWKYPDDFPQDKIIQEIENYLEWEISKMKNIADSDTYKYINDKD
jgi:hypothetical protein